MFNGYLKMAGQEIINSARTEAYAKAFLPGLEVLPISAGLRERLGHIPYVSPAADRAPWYRAENPASARFYGLYPTALDGDDDSTRSIDVTELSGDGAVHSMPRHGSRDLRFVVMALAADHEALEEGMAWLRNALDPGGCVANSLGCGGWDAQMFASLPASPGAPNPLRNWYKVELLEGPRVTQRFASKRVATVKLEFILNAGVPWPFTPMERVTSLDMNTGVVSVTDPANEDCSAVESAYDKFINDPYFTAITPPPKAPVVAPPNILDISSWRRRTVPVPLTVTQRWGRTVPVVTVDAHSRALQQVRLRFYRRTVNLQGCDYEGEFLISYLPPNSTMTLNAITKEARVTLPDGTTVPGEHLLYGSDGLPFMWPTLSCRDAYTFVVDMMPGNTDLVVTLDVAVRE